MARADRTPRGRRNQSLRPRPAPPRTTASDRAAAHTSPRTDMLPDSIGSVRDLSRRAVWPVLALGLLVGTSYVPAMQAGFVWDDTIFAESAAVQDWSGIWKIWFSPSDIRREGHYWPIVYSTFWLEHKIWGFDPTGYHVVNIVLHFVNCVLLWWLMRCLAVPGAWAIAAVFAVHPLHVESVAWVIERKDLLSGLFYLSAVLAWIRFVNAPATGRYLATLGLFLASLLSKSIAVTLPVALLIHQWWNRGRVTAADLLRLVPFFALALAVTLADLAYYRGIESVSFDFSFVERALIAARALWFYVGKLLWPTPLAVVYPHWSVDAAEPTLWVCLVSAAMVAGLLWVFRDRLGRGPLAGALFFVVTLSPVLGFVDYGYMQFSFVADRYQYLAGIGVLAVFVGAGAQAVSRMGGVWTRCMHGLGVVVLVTLGAVTWRQAGIYRNQITFFRHVIAHNPDARDAHYNLGRELVIEGRPEEALGLLRIAVERRPDSAAARTNLGRALLLLGRYEEAESELRRAVDLEPRNKVFFLNMGEAHRYQGEHELALASYRKALEIDPDYALAHAGSGDALLNLGRHREALEVLERGATLPQKARSEGATQYLIGRTRLELDQIDRAEEHFQRALDIFPQDANPLHDLARIRMFQGRIEEATAYLQRARELGSVSSAAFKDAGEAFAKQGRYEEALEAYGTALEIDPELAEAHLGRGNALFQLERYEEAIKSMSAAAVGQPNLRSEGSFHRFMGIASQALGRADAAFEHFRQAQQINPRDAVVLDHLALLHFTRKQFAEAVELYEDLVEINPESAHAHANLGSARASLGRYQAALESFERALSLDPELDHARSGLQQVRGSL